MTVLQSVKYRVRTLYATADELTAANPVLLEGEWATEKVTGRRKIGPGAWNSLPYWDPGAAAGGIISVNGDTGVVVLDAADVGAELAGAVATHAAAADPHPGYLTPAEADLAYATAAQGVTNGNSHDHSGGDGGQIAYSSLSGTPSLGGAALLSVGITAGTVAAGDDSRITGALSAVAAEAAYQPLDTDLSAIAALSTTSFGRSFLALADAAAGRTLLNAARTDPTGITGASAISNIVTLSQANYDAIETPDAATLYVVTD